MSSPSRSLMVLSPKRIRFNSNEIEIAVHEPNSSIKRELKYFLKANNTIYDNDQQVFIITTCQESKVELLEWGKDTDFEKDRLLRVFCEYGEYFHEKITSLGYWADYVDPASGLLVHSQGQVVWPEVQTMERLRGFKISKAGPCHILLHPQWGSKIYPASMFSNAPKEIIMKIIGAEPE